jgi:hypothetical protein
MVNEIEHVAHGARPPRTAVRADQREGRESRRRRYRQVVGYRQCLGVHRQRVSAKPTRVVSHTGQRAHPYGHCRVRRVEHVESLQARGLCPGQAHEQPVGVHRVGPVTFGPVVDPPQHLRGLRVRIAAHGLIERVRLDDDVTLDHEWRAHEAGAEDRRARRLGGDGERGGDHHQEPGECRSTLQSAHVVLLRTRNPGGPYPQVIAPNLGRGRDGVNNAPVRSHVWVVESVVRTCAGNRAGACASLILPYFTSVTVCTASMPVPCRRTR